MHPTSSREEAASICQGIHDKGFFSFTNCSAITLLFFLPRKMLPKKGKRLLSQRAGERKGLGGAEGGSQVSCQPDHAMPSTSRVCGILYGRISRKLSRMATRAVFRLQHYMGQGAGPSLMGQGGGTALLGQAGPPEQ